MDDMFDVSGFLTKFEDPDALTRELRELLAIWNDLEKHTITDQDLQRRASALIAKIRQDRGLNEDDIMVILDNEAAFRAQLRHPSRPRV
jgi:hypothetical protein